MATIEYPAPIKTLISHLKQLPGVGPKSAERIAIWMIQHGRELTGQLSESLAVAGETVGECDICGFFAAENEECRICHSSGRESDSLCVIEHPTDVLLLERSGAYKGQYHVLRGKISPLDNVGPDDLRIAELQDRLTSGDFKEIILALSADVEGEATANYLAEILSDFGDLKVSRLAHGISVGGGLESADELTLLRALEGRIGMR
ncbi:MAG: recombination mediator RecR [Verrucomicrobiales bacterium]|nr:recombination mediator RecR [Verrucomicrobiales bacterium]